MDNNRDFEQDTPSEPSRSAGGRPPRRRPTVRWAAGLGAAAVLIGGGAALAASSGSAQPGRQYPGRRPQRRAHLGQRPERSRPRRHRGRHGHDDPGRHVRPPVRQGRGRPEGGRPPPAARRARAACRGRLGRLRLAIRGEHGQVTFKAKGGTTKTLAFERGKVTAVNGTAVTVQAADGTTWTWHLVSDSVVRQGGKKVATSAVAAGQQVFAGGPVVNGADDARLIVIRPATPAASPSSSATTSGS